MDFRACSDEIPPCSFETARRLLWRNINNELLPVYDRQLCECYLQPQILRCECLGDNKWVLNQKPLIIAQAFTTSITQIWVKPSGIPQIWVNPQIWAITQNWGNHAQVTQNWVLHLFLRVVIYLFNIIPIRICKYHTIFISSGKACHAVMMIATISDHKTNQCRFNWCSIHKYWMEPVLKAMSILF